MRKLAIFITTLIFAVTSFSSAKAQIFDQFSSTTWDNFGDQNSFISTGIEILHIDSNYTGTALVESGGVGFHFGGVSSVHSNPENSLWFAMAAMLGTIGVVGDDALIDAIVLAVENGATVTIITSPDGTIYWDYGYGPGGTMGAGEYVDWIVNNPGTATQWIINFALTGDSGDPVQQ